MAKETSEQNDSQLIEKRGLSNFSRRSFLKYGSASAGIVLLATACGKDNPNQTPIPTPSTTVDLGSGDIGILNYAYALEQLEAAFYTKVMASSSTGLSATELSLFADIKLHEVAHREFFKNALGSNAIPSLTVNFSSIDFSSRTSILNTAKAFENLGVAAYNGAGRLLVTPDYLVLAGKIVSIEARHAAYINDLINPGSFAETTDIDGLDPAMNPPDVLAIAGTYITTPIDASHLPS